MIMNGTLTRMENCYWSISRNISAFLLKQVKETRKIIYEDSWWPIKTQTAYSTNIRMIRMKCLSYFIFMCGPWFYSLGIN
jgi:hypothetical protein